MIHPSDENFAPLLDISFFWVPTLSHWIYSCFLVTAHFPCCIVFLWCMPIQWTLGSGAIFCPYCLVPPICSLFAPRKSSSHTLYLSHVWQCHPLSLWPFTVLAAFVLCQFVLSTPTELVVTSMLWTLFILTVPCLYRWPCWLLSSSAPSFWMAFYPHIWCSLL